MKMLTNKISPRISQLFRICQFDSFELIDRTSNQTTRNSQKELSSLKSFSGHPLKTSVNSSISSGQRYHLSCTLDTATSIDTVSTLMDFKSMMSSIIQRSRVSCPSQKNRSGFGSQRSTPRWKLRVELFSQRSSTT